MVTGVSAGARHLLASHISISSFLHRGQDTEHCLILIHCTTGVTLLPVSQEILRMFHISFIRFIQPKQIQKLEREVNILWWTPPSPVYAPGPVLPEPPSPV